MSGLLFLTTDDFKIVDSPPNKKVMCTSIRGFSVVLFYSTDCKHCHSLIPIFKKLPSVVPGCQFGMINVSQNRQCAIMSRDTIAPITVVPYIILFVNGRPHSRYQGPHDLEKISRFVADVAHNIKMNQQQQSNTPQRGAPTHPQKDKNTIQNYIGHPLYGTDQKVCYLDFQCAYPGKTKGQHATKSFSKRDHTGGYCDMSDAYKKHQQQMRK